MKDLALLNAVEILGISVPEKLFSVKTEDELKRSYRKLSTLWHPDKHILKGEDTSPIFAHIQGLYEKAVQKMADGDWGKGNVFRVDDTAGNQFEIKYLVQNIFEFGIRYVGRGIVAWVFNKEDEEFVIRASRFIRNLKFANDKMKVEVKKYIPEIIREVKTKDSIILVLKKDEQTLSLRDILNYCGGFVDPKHVAWILSGMYNLACFNQYNKVMQAGFSLDNYFINPMQHTGQIVGGWWFSHEEGEKLKALSTDAVNVAPIKMLNNKIADIKLDLELIKLVGRQLLGDGSGIKLRKDSRIPKSLINWLNDSSQIKPYEAYELWQNKILKESFGVRRFTKMDVTINDIYP